MMPAAGWISSMKLSGTVLPVFARLAKPTSASRTVKPNARLSLTDCRSSSVTAIISGPMPSPGHAINSVVFIVFLNYFVGSSYLFRRFVLSLHFDIGCLHFRPPAIEFELDEIFELYRGVTDNLHRKLLEALLDVRHCESLFRCSA